MFRANFKNNAALLFEIARQSIGVGTNEKCFHFFQNLFSAQKIAQVLVRDGAGFRKLYKQFPLKGKSGRKRRK
jgi:hypothetical protein